MAQPKRPAAEGKAANPGKKAPVPVTSRDTRKPTDSVPMATGAFAALPVQFGRYQVEKLLGRGAMGAVYLATDTQLDRPVALKVPRVSAAGSVKLLKRLEVEAKAAAKLNHPNICGVYDYGVLNDTHYIALQYVQGQDLKSWLKAWGKPLEPQDAVELMLVLLEAVGEAHRKGIIHRDLKPENIMLKAGDGAPVIMDFGLARQSQGSTNASLTQGAVVGTALYMSPEQVNGKAEGIDHQTDIYALGIILFELLTGAWPFTGTAFEVMGQKTIQDPPTPLEIDAKLPPQLAAVCLKMITRKKDERYRSCADVAAALKAVDFDAPVTPESGNEQRAPLSAPAPGLLPRIVVEQTPAVTPRRAAAGRRRTTPGRWSSSWDWWNRQSGGVRWSLLGGAAGALLLLAVVFLLPTPVGTLRIEIEDPAILVRLDGESITIDNDGQPIRVAATAKHTLEIEQNGTIVDAATQEVVLRRGEQRLLKVSLLNGQVTINGLPVAATSTPAAPGTTTGLTALPPGVPAIAPAVPATSVAASEWPAGMQGGHAGQVRAFTSLGMKFCWCPPGTFLMGSKSFNWKANANETPQVEVTLTKGFWMGQTEVTQFQWQQIMSSSPWVGKHHYRVGPLYPATFVNRDDAVTFCRKLTERERAAGRISADQIYSLPSEAQWEYACRAGTTTTWYFGNDDRKLVDYAWCRENSWERERFAHQVARKKPNAWNLYDMHGNVSEWCAGDYEEQLKGGIDPGVSRGSGVPFLRSSAYFHDAADSRAAKRQAYRLNGEFFDGIGFRVALRSLARPSAAQPVPATVGATGQTSSGSGTATNGPFFNGKDLSGWEGLPGYWQVEDGAIVGRCPAGQSVYTYLASERSYKNFELKFDARRRGGDSSIGVLFRSWIADRTKFKGYGPQVDIATPGGAFPVGSLVTEPNASPLAVKANLQAVTSLKRNDFNRFHIRCVGQHVTIRVNNIVAVSGTYQLPEAGRIAWPLDGGATEHEIVIRNIEFTELNDAGEGVTTSAAASGQSSIPTGVEVYGDKHFKLFSEHSTWQAAKDRCTALGGRLAEIHSASENYLIMSMATKARVEGVWLGASDAAQEGRWQWNSNAGFTYSNWDTGQPNNKKGGENYLFMTIQTSPGRWSDQPNDSLQFKTAFVCEWDANAVIPAAVSANIPVASAGGTPTIPEADLAARSRWVTPGGIAFVRQPGGSWSELVEQGKRYEFLEGERTPVYIELKGVTEPDNVYRLYSDRALINRKGNGYVLKYNGSWSADSQQSAADKTPVKWTEIFNGKDLTGWTPMVTTVKDLEIQTPTTSGWVVRDGELICNTTSAGWLRLDQQWGDFELEFDFVLPLNTNSGLLVRYPGQGKMSGTDICEIQLEYNPAKKHVWFCGAIFGIASPSVNAFRPGRWNTMSVKAADGQITVTLNDVEVTTARMADHESLRKLPVTGYIGLFNYRGQAKGCKFRNIRIRAI